MLENAHVDLKSCYSRKAGHTLMRKLEGRLNKIIKMRAIGRAQPLW